MAAESVPIKDRYTIFQALQNLVKNSEEIFELAGTHHPYRFELEDTSSVDRSDSSNEENELQDRLIKIRLCIV